MTEAVDPAAPKCQRCGDAHQLIACPHVKAIDFEDADPNLIRRVEFLTPADYGPPAAATTEAPAPPGYPRLGQKG